MRAMFVVQRNVRIKWSGLSEGKQLSLAVEDRKAGDRFSYIVLQVSIIVIGVTWQDCRIGLNESTELEYVY